MGVLSVSAPVGGIVAKIGGASYPAVLRNSEIEKFEEHYDLGIFAVAEVLLGRGSDGRTIQARHIRDIVALGLIGGGMSQNSADVLLAEQPPYANVDILAAARDLVVAAFAIPKKDAAKKKPRAGGSQRKRQSGGTSPAKSEASPE